MDRVSWKAVVLIVTIVILAVIVWLGRYEMVAVHSGGQTIGGGVAYRLDRWTGELVWVSSSSAGKVEISESKP